jgi:hypothetical protein
MTEILGDILLVVKRLPILKGLPTLERLPRERLPTMEERVARIKRRARSLDLVADAEIEERALMLHRQEQERTPLMQRATLMMLSVAGDFVAGSFKADEYERYVLKDPEAVSGKGAIMVRMKAGRCHTNAAALHLDHPDRYLIATGWALDRDEEGFEIWRSHSWNVEKASGEIVETTPYRLGASTSAASSRPSSTGTVFAECQIPGMVEGGG